MADLYCARHGRECESAVQAREPLIREDGESVVIVKGKLISGPWRCDRCNAVLERGRTAYLYAAWPRWDTERMNEYGFELERDYFALKGRDTVTQYGAPWPGGTIAAMLEWQRWREL
jgi:hypothetical protein